MNSYVVQHSVLGKCNVCILFPGSVFEVSFLYFFDDIQSQIEILFHQLFPSLTVAIGHNKRCSSLKPEVTIKSFKLHQRASWRLNIITFWNLRADTFYFQSCSQITGILYNITDLLGSIGPKRRKCRGIWAHLPVGLSAVFCWGQNPISCRATWSSLGPHPLPATRHTLSLSKL